MLQRLPAIRSVTSTSMLNCSVSDWLSGTVNFDDPGSYHFYFGDAVGTPGTILTFFSWPGSRRGMHGSGEVSATAFTIPTGSAGYWLERLKLYHVTVERAPKRLGEEVVRFADPDGMLIELIESTPSNAVLPWGEGPVPAEHFIQGLHGVSARLQSLSLIHI